MLEQLLSIGSGGNYQFCPEDITGPGPQCMTYTEEDDKGFFGEVPNTQLITMSALTSQMGVTQGTVQNLDTPWLKFYLDGRILYVAKKTIRRSISYDHLRDLGLVDGSKIITINGLQYRVGLLSGIDDGYSEDASSGYNQSWTMRSEWTRLMYNVSADDGIHTTRQKQGQIGDNWVSYPQDDSEDGLNISVGDGRYSWCKELNPGDLTQAIQRGNGSVAYVYPYGSSITGAYRGWRPVLELDLELHAPELYLAHRYNPNDFFTDNELFDAPPADLKHGAILPSDPIEELLP